MCPPALRHTGGHDMKDAPMQASQIEIVPFGPEHLEAAVALSR
ncbi:GNAT family N-acetyltransferase, partial [Rhizobium ruizarguesonis]